MWDINDKQGFEIESSCSRGQINIDQDFGKIIYELAKNADNKIFVEIGTWNGLGSTKCFIEAMKTNKDTTLYTIENNTEKYEFAKSRWVNTIVEYNLTVNFLNGSLINIEDVYRWISKNNIYLDDNQKYWLSIDKTNSTNIIKLGCQYIDILLIDGGEYSGFLELMLLKPISKYILLDDVNSIKNKTSREYLLSNTSYELISEDLNSRNGYSIFKNIINNL